MIGTPRRGRTTALLAACHPLPCLAVTAFALAYAVAVLHRLADPAPMTVLRCLLGVPVAVGTGQLSIGWSNDALDAARDARAGRLTKPVAAGDVATRIVWAAAVSALVVCVLASLLLGPVAAAAHLVAVAAAWAYNLGLKAAPLSPLPYLVAFGLLPSVVTGAAGLGVAPAGPTLAAALLGLAAHFANTVADADADALTGVRGLPQRLGPAASLSVTALAVASGAAVLLGAAPHRSVGVVAVLTLAGLIAVGTATVGARAAGGPGRGVPGTRAAAWAFRLTLFSVALVVGGFVAASA